MAETTLGQRIARVRERAGLTQVQMARRFGDSDRAATASDWERGKTVPDTGTIIQMVRDVGVNGHWLLTGEGDIDDAPDLAEQAVAEIEGVLERMRERARVEATPPATSEDAAQALEAERLGERGGESRQADQESGQEPAKRRRRKG